MVFLPRAINSVASPCTPVPQSKIRRLPLAVVSSTQEVLPPKWFVPGPGVAIDPLVPQKRTFMSLRLPCVRHRPIGNSIPLLSRVPPIAAAARRFRACRFCAFGHLALRPLAPQCPLRQNGHHYSPPAAGAPG